MTASAYNNATLFLTRSQHDEMLDRNPRLLRQLFSLSNRRSWSLAGVELQGLPLWLCNEGEAASGQSLTPTPNAGLSDDEAFKRAFDTLTRSRKGEATTEELHALGYMMQTHGAAVIRAAKTLTGEA